MTEVLAGLTESGEPHAENIARCASILRSGGVVAFPTETVYGLGADALNASAVARIFQAKGRPSDNPLIVHISDPSMLARVASAIPPAAQLAMEAFWPGPLTLILPRAEGVPGAVTGGLDTVGVRLPDHPVARALIARAGVPVAAPSANRSGRPSPTTAEHVLADVAGRIEAILDGGPTGVGVESTVLDVTADPPEVLRPGSVTLEDLQAVLGPVGLAAHVRDPHLTPDLRDPGPHDPGEGPRSPGMKYVHYAPSAPLWLVEGAPGRVAERIRRLIGEFRAQGKRVGVLASRESAGRYTGDVVLSYGSRSDAVVVAASLFARLREFDLHDVDVIVAEGIPPEGMGLAVMDRLRRAAGGRVIPV